MISLPQGSVELRLSPFQQFLTRSISASNNVDGNVLAHVRKHDWSRMFWPLTCPIRCEILLVRWCIIFPKYLHRFPGLACRRLCMWMSWRTNADSLISPLIVLGKFSEGCLILQSQFLSCKGDKSSRKTGGGLFYCQKIRGDTASTTIC